MSDLVERWNALETSEYEKGLAAGTEDYNDHPCEYSYAERLVDMFEAGQALLTRITELETALAEGTRVDKARTWDACIEARNDERAKVVAWLLEQAKWHDKYDDGWSGFDKIAQGYREAADAIEKGVHKNIS